MISRCNARLSARVRLGADCGCGMSSSRALCLRTWWWCDGSPYTEYDASHEVWKGVNGDEAEMFFQSINLANGFQLSLNRLRELGQRYALLNLRHNSPVNVSPTSKSDG